MSSLESPETEYNQNIYHLNEIVEPLDQRISYIWR